MNKLYYTYVNELDINKYKNIISSQRLMQALKYKNFLDQKRSIACELLLIESLKENNLNPIINYNYNSLGKPSLENYPNFFFNYSHSKDISACVVSNNNIGLDIEAIKDLSRKKVERFCNRLMTDNQKEDILKDDYIEKFYKYWVIKESFSKLLGIGLGISFRKVNICELKNQVWIDKDNKANFYYLKINNYSVCITSFQDINLEVQMKSFVD